jgi:hypothetical protein
LLEAMENAPALHAQVLSLQPPPLSRCLASFSFSLWRSLDFSHPNNTSLSLSVSVSLSPHIHAYTHSHIHTFTPRSCNSCRCSR